MVINTGYYIIIIIITIFFKWKNFIDNNANY